MIQARRCSTGQSSHVCSSQRWIFGRFAALGWAGLWTDPGLLAAGVAGGIELGRAVAPLSLVDDATLGAPLCVEGRVRHGAGRVEGGEREPMLDGSGTLRGVALPFRVAPERLRA